VICPYRLSAAIKPLVFLAAALLPPLGAFAAPTPVPPIIDPIPDQTIAPGIAYTGPTPTLSQGTLPVTWSLQVGPAGMTIDSATGVVSWANPNLVGSRRDVEIQAINGPGSSDNELWVLTVIVPGDVSLNGLVLTEDVELLKNHLLNVITLSPIHLEAADFNQDGAVDIIDLVGIDQNRSDRPTPTPTPIPTPTPTPLPGDTINLPGGVTIDLVGIPFGQFQMGRYPGEQDSRPEEDPQHTVTLGYSFYMAKTELTKAQWQALMNTTPWWGEADVINDPDSPAVYVTWNDAQNYIAAINYHVTSTGQGPATFRLPSESEWEYACRAGTTTRFYWGDDPAYSQIGDYAWYKGNAWDIGEKYAHVVGLKLPNAWGLHDMSGNVWEWCQDWWHTDYSQPGRPDDGSAWATQQPGYPEPVVRGGYWLYFPGYCRSAYRDRYFPAGRFNLLGFRLSRDPY
jgi:formylglycine-generating enzyme required for sulfatase activity